jgi:putative membrane-bound dehydrogenase-like protein
MFSMKRLGLLVFLAGCAEAGAPPALPPHASPLDPLEERASFQLPPGFEVSLVAAEPDVIDPVAMAFDERGRLYVVEMPGFPNGDSGEGTPSIPGRVKLLEHPDAEHRFRKCTTFINGLNFPTSVMPYKKGVLVACAPEILYFEDSDGDGRADLRRTIYTGFGQKNIEAQVNGLQWALDNWVHGLGSFNGGDIRALDRMEKPAVALQGRGFRFRPDDPGRFEPTLCRGQWGLACDDWGRWFTCTNSEHLKHVALDDRYLSREPVLVAPPAVVNIPDHGAAAKLFRVSPFEAWRVERTSRRAHSEQRSRFSPTELVPGGFVTSGCGIATYGGGLFPAEYAGNSFICDPANNLVHRDILAPRGATFVARRAPREQEREFLASSDPWFRPVNLAVGPDGALYVADFYREVIEGASFIPEDIKSKLQLNFQSGGRGRIWRVAPKGGASMPSFGTTAELVASLAHPNSWCRLTAQRLLVQDQRKEAVPAIRTLLSESGKPFARLHALWTLEGLGALEEAALTRALKDPDPGIREHALRLAEARPTTFGDVLRLADDESPRVRFQLALTIGGVDARATTLAALAARDGEDPYARAAILSSSGNRAVELYLAAVRQKAPDSFLGELARLVGARLDPTEISSLLSTMKEAGDGALAASLAGMAQGLRQRRKGKIEIPGARPALAAFLGGRTEAVRKSAVELASQVRMMSEEELRAALVEAKEQALDEKRPPQTRIEAILILGSGDFASISSTLSELLGPRQAESIQQAAGEALGAQSDPGVARVILDRWGRYTPKVREKMIEILFDRKERLAPLLEAIGRGDVSAAELDNRRRSQLLNFPDKDISGRAASVLKEAKPDPGLFEAAKGALAMTGDPSRGRAIFRKLCISCHQAGGEGAVVGPGLASVRDNPPEDILKNILYPSLVIAPQYAQYVVETANGQVMNGLIVESSEAAITLRRQGVEDAKLLRRDIRNLVVSRVSLMPEDLLKGLSLQEIGDLLKFVREIQ